MASVYPGSYDELNFSGNPIRNDLVARLNIHGDAIEATQHELGLNPSSTYATVAARLDAIQQQLDDLSADTSTALADVLDAHTDAADPHSGKYGKIITPSQPDGGGKLYIAGSPSASGPDNEAWIDTAS